MLELWTLCTALPLIMLFPYMKFHFNSSSKSGVIVRTKFERKNQQRAITQKICMLELWPLCTALPLIMLFPYMKFHFNSSGRTGVIVRTKFERKNQQRAITQKICMVQCLENNEFTQILQGSTLGSFLIDLYNLPDTTANYLLTKSS